MSRKAIILLIIAGIVVAGLGASLAASSWLAPSPEALDALGADPACSSLSLVDSVLCDITGRAPPTSLQQTGDLVTGRWVSFRVDVANDTIRDLAARGPFADAAVFQSIQLPQGTLANAVQGPLWAGRVGSLSVLIGDGPGNLIAVRNRADAPATIVLTAAPDVTIAQVANGTGLKLTHGTHDALLKPFGNATLGVQGQVITATLPTGAGLAFAIPGFGAFGKGPFGPMMGEHHRVGMGMRMPMPPWGMPMGRWRGGPMGLPMPLPPMPAPMPGSDGSAQSQGPSF